MANGAWQYVSGLAATNYTMTNLTELNDYYRVQVRGTCPAIRIRAAGHRYWYSITDVLHRKQLLTEANRQQVAYTDLRQYILLTQQIYTPNEVGVSSEGGTSDPFTLEKISSSISTANPTIYMGVTSRMRLQVIRVVRSFRVMIYLKYMNLKRQVLLWTATTSDLYLPDPYFYNGQDNLVLAMYVDNQTTTSPHVIQRRAVKTVRHTSTAVHMPMPIRAAADIGSQYFRWWIRLIAVTSALTCVYHVKNRALLPKPMPPRPQPRWHGRPTMQKQVGLWNTVQKAL